MDVATGAMKKQLGPANVCHLSFCLYWPMKVVSFAGETWECTLPAHNDGQPLSSHWYIHVVPLVVVKCCCGGETY